MLIKKVFKFSKIYFLESNDRWVACLLLLTTFLLTLLSIGLMACFSYCFTGFWTAMVAMKMPLLLQKTFWCIVNIIGLAVCDYFNKTCISQLSVRWITWLRKNLLQQYLKSDSSSSDNLCKLNNNQSNIPANNFIDIMRAPEQMTTPEQRILDDARRFVKYTLFLTQGILFSVLQFCTSVGMLWILGGTLSFTILGISIIIPGFLIWAVVLFSMIKAYSIHSVGSGLVNINRELEKNDAELYQELTMVQQNFEFIGQENGQTYYQSTMSQKVNDIAKIAEKKLEIEAHVSSFRTLQTFASALIPFLVAAPLYLTGRINIGSFMQIGMQFNQVGGSLDLFVTLYEKLASYRSSTERLDELTQAYRPNGLKTSPKNIQYKQEDSSNSNKIIINRLKVCLPNNSEQVLFEDLNLEIESGQHTLIEGGNGSGKTTFFKVLAGTWKHGDGLVSMPKDVMFFPQKVTIPKSNLKAILAYPKSPNQFTDEDFKQALLQADLGSYTTRLDDINTPWFSTLSGGEQQKIGFARVFLNKPQWLFLDEATSALSEENEYKMYDRLGKNLTSTTIISIGHSDKIRRFHKKTIFFEKNEQHIHTRISHQNLNKHLSNN